MEVEGSQRLFNKGRLENGLFYLPVSHFRPWKQKAAKKKEKKKSVSVSGGVDLLPLPDWTKPELFAFADRRSEGRRPTGRSAVRSLSGKVRGENTDEKAKVFPRYLLKLSFLIMHF